MKKGILLIISILLSSLAYSQVVVYTENFELPSLADSVSSTQTTPGVNDWAISTKLSTIYGLRSDTCQVKSLLTTYLTSTSFNTIGNTYVLLEFNHICKVDFLDAATLEVSGDNGQTWVQLTANEYLGTANFSTNGNRFAANSYGNSWLPANATATPDNTWWKPELFNISAVTGNVTNAKVRFKLSDGGTPGPNSNYGWLIDDIKITAALSELTPPVFTNFTPTLIGNIFNTGPFQIQANITDASGLSSVFLPITWNGIPDTIPCINTSGTLYKATIPKASHLDTICYKMVAIDNSLSHNVGQYPTFGNFCFTASTQEATLLSMPFPNTACGLGLETVTIQIKNTGLDTINGNFIARYYVVGTIDTVNQPVTNIIPPGATINFSFTQKANLTAVNNDVTFTIKAYIVLDGDPVPSNNSFSKTLVSGFVPPNPGVTNVTINYATTTTLTAVTPAPKVEWYADSLGTILLDTGHTFTTPVLFATKVYYVRAISGMLSCKSNIVPDTVFVGSMPPYDGAVEKIITPVTSVYMTANEIVKIMVKSHGTGAITNFPVYYKVNNNAPVMEMITDTIDPGDSLIYTFNTKVNLTTIGTYNFKAYCVIAGDLTTLNDTAYAVVNHVLPVYCQSYAINAASNSDIGNVTISNLNNGIATPPQPNPLATNGYTDFTSLNAVQMAIGLTYPISISKISQSAAPTQTYVKVFIDLNRNGLFEETTETVFTGNIALYNYSTSGNIVIPTWVNPGLTLMRVVLQDVSSPASVHACNPYPTGETEDYNMVMYPQIPFDAGVTQINTPAALVPETSSQPVQVVVKNYGLDTLTTFQVFYKVNNNAPVSVTWNGVLLPAATTLVTLPNFIVLGGDNNICSYTVTNDDTNPGNDFTCKYFYGDPQQNAQAVSLLEPTNTGCSVGLEPVKIRIKNVGLDTIQGGLTAHYKIKGSTNVVSEPVTATILPNQFYNYQFNTLCDLTAYVKDTIFTLISYLTLTGDFVKSNDTTSISVESLYSPPIPVSGNVTIPYATQATLTATSPDSVIWFSNATTPTPLAGGTTYTTPILYGQDVLWVQAQIKGNPVYASIGTGTSLTSTLPVNPYDDYSWSACLYLASELGYSAGNLDSIAYQVGNTSGLPYTMNNQKIYMAHTTATTITSNTKPNPATMTQVYDGTVIWQTQGWKKIGLTNKFPYNGSDNLLIYYENWDGSWSSPYPSFNYTSTTPSNRALYFSQDASFPTGPGTLTVNRPNIRIIGSSTGCPSGRISDTVFITNAPPYDGALLSLVAPVSAVNLTMAEPVKVKVKSYGTAPINNFAVSYQINGGFVITDSIFTTLNQGDTLVHTFSIPANMLNYGTYNFKAWISVPGDNTPMNDTIFKAVGNLIPPYCVSYSSQPTTREDIGNVTISNMNNGSALPTLSNPTATNGYTNYTNLAPIQLAPGVAHPISVSAKSAYTTLYACSVKVYVDWNRDGDFTDANEMSFAFRTTTTNPTASGNLNCPVNAVTGTTVMRVVLDELGTAQPCGIYTYGETEDYLVMIAPLIPQDAGVVKFLQPGKLGVEGDVVPVQVQIRNYGTQMLTAGSINIAYEVNFGTPLLYTHTADLAPTQTATVSLPWHTLLRGNNQICAYTIVFGDSNTFNDKVCHDIYGQFTATLPYSDNMDGVAAEFWPDSVPNQWERGIPSGQVINTAHSTPYVWETELSGAYTNNSLNYLYTPKISHIITGIDSLKFWHQVHANNMDGGSIQYLSILGWKILGTQNDPAAINWYNSPMGMWTNTGGGPGWQRSTYDLSTINDLAEPTQFRFLFLAVQPNTAGFEGWAIDDFSMTLPRIPKDAGVEEIVGPPSPTVIGTNMSIQVRIKNFGKDTLYAIPVKFAINGATVGSELWTGTLLPDSTVVHTFANYPSPLQGFTLCSFTTLQGDIHLYNDKACDTLDVIAPEYDAGIVDIISPANPTIFSDISVVKVLVQNFGRSPIYDLTFEYTVAGDKMSTETWSSPNPLQPGDTMTFTFDTTYTHDFIGYYYLCAKAILQNDGYPYNDERCEIYEELWTEITETDINGYELGLCIPNPTHGVTTIPVTVPASGEVRLSIVNNLGQPVHYQDLKLSAGTHNISYDVSSLSRGVYFYYTEYQGRKLIRKMIVD